MPFLLEAVQDVQDLSDVSITGNNERRIAMFRLSMQHGVYLRVVCAFLSYGIVSIDGGGGEGN